MRNDKASLQPKYGYIIAPEKGKRLFYVGLAAVILPPIYFLIMYLRLGPEGMDAWWQVGKVKSTHSPIFVPEMILIGIAVITVCIQSYIIKGLKRTIACLSSAYIISTIYEIIGVNFFDGGVFGPYNYNIDAIDFIFGGEAHILGVPLVVGAGWLLYAIPSYYLALYLVPTEELGRDKSIIRKIGNVLVVSTVGALFIFAVDVMVDPLAVDQGMYIWHVNGDVYPWLLGAGEPRSNFTGWMICGFTMMVAFYLILQTTPPERHTRSPYLDLYFPLTLYAAAFVTNFTEALIFLKKQDVLLFGGALHGGLLLIVLVKLYMEKRGAMPNPIGLKITQRFYLRKRQIEGLVEELARKFT